MQWIHYLGGRGKSGKIVAIGIGMSHDPDLFLSQHCSSLPFDAELLKIEEGSQELLDGIRQEYQVDHLNGPWYRVSDKLMDRISALKLTHSSGTRRVSLDLSVQEFDELSAMVKELGTRTKSRLLRRALRFFLALRRYKARGYVIQAIKGGLLTQFHDFDDINDPP